MTKTAKKSAAEADPRFAPVAAAFARTPGFSIMGSKSGALQGMMLHGKSFGMSTHGRFVLKVDEARAEALIADGTAEAFEMRPGKPMKGWIEVTSPRADWVALAKEAYGMAAAGGGAKKGAAKKGSAKKGAAKKGAAKKGSAKKGAAKKGAAKKSAAKKGAAKKSAAKKGSAKKKSARGKR